MAGQAEVQANCSEHMVAISPDPRLFPHLCSEQFQAQSSLESLKDFKQIGENTDNHHDTGLVMGQYVILMSISHDYMRSNLYHDSVLIFIF